VLRVEVTEEGQGALPSLDLEGAFVIGSAADARVRLPATVAKPEHVRVEGTRWRALAPAGVAEAAGEVGDGVAFSIGGYRVRVAPAPPGVAPTPPQRTESLARELMRSLMGTSGAPTLEIEVGPLAGAKRPLAPPESTLVIGRGDEAGWIIADDDLSRAHAEIRRGWDGVRIVDLDSKNGTKVDGVTIEGEMMISDGAEIRLGKVVLRFRDPAEKHLRAEPAKPAAPAGRDPVIAPRAPAPAAAAKAKASAVPFYAAIAIMLVALAGLVWIVSS